MKILILQSMCDAVGGIYFVNKELVKMFNEEGYEVYVVSARLSGYYQDASFPKYVHNLVINNQDVWGIIRYSSILVEIKKLHLITAIKMFNERIKYSKRLIDDYQKIKAKIHEISPDFIINSHYELLDAIPDDYLNKTIMHFHTNFSIVKKNSSYRKLFHKYKDKIYKFVWLTEATKNEAIKFGLKNSICIYNSVRIQSNEVSNVTENKNIVFLGRASREKRIDLLLNIFDSISALVKDWTLTLYVIGELTEDCKKIIEHNANIINKGATKNLEQVFMTASLNINTSEFEGFSMTILEANEFGVPTISFNFGESVNEEIKNNETGIVVEQNNVALYKKALLEVMNNPEKLKRLSDKCKKFNQNFSYNIIKEEWLKLLTGGK